MRLWILGALLALIALTAAPSATSCLNAIPIGHIVTPACTWIVRQHDPGVFVDQLGHYWVMAPCVDGVCSSQAIDVGADPSVLKIGK